MAYYELGSIYAAIKKTDKAEEYLAKAWEREPSNYWYVIAYNQILTTNKKYAEAIKICRQYLKAEKDNNIRFSIAESLEELGKNKQALRVLNEIESENGLSEMISLKKVEIYKKTGEFDKGLAELMKLRNFIPEAPEYNVLVAEFLDETGDKKEAVKYYQIAYDLDSTNVYAITNLADYYNREGFTDTGFFYLGKAFGLDQITVDKKINTLMFFLKNDSLLSNNTREIGNLVAILCNKYPDNYDVNTMAYDFYNQTNEVDKAYGAIQRLLKLKNDNFLIWQQALYNATTVAEI